MSRILESGIPTYLKSKAMLRMKSDARSSGTTTHKTLEHCNGCALVLVHFQGSFGLYGILMVSAGLVFLAEAIRGAVARKKAGKA